jgi:hypothetical protein
MPPVGDRHRAAPGRSCCAGGEGVVVLSRDATAPAEAVVDRRARPLATLATCSPMWGAPGVFRSTLLVSRESGSPGAALAADCQKTVAEWEYPAHGNRQEVRPDG